MMDRGIHPTGGWRGGTDHTMGREGIPPHQKWVDTSPYYSFLFLKKKQKKKTVLLYLFEIFIF
jgi:hypothetical protein